MLTVKLVPEMSEEIFLEDYKAIFNKTREATSSHPPIHYSHYKASCESDSLVAVNLAFMSLPFQHGIPLEK